MEMVLGIVRLSYFPPGFNKQPSFARTHKEVLLLVAKAICPKETRDEARSYVMTYHSSL